MINLVVKKLSIYILCGSLVVTIDNEENTIYVTLDKNLTLVINYLVLTEKDYNPP